MSSIFANDPFPKPLRHKGRGPKRHISLTRPQVSWLRKYYPDYPNKAIIAETGLSPITLYRRVHDLGIRKSPEYIHTAAIRRGVLITDMYNRDARRLTLGLKPLSRYRRVCQKPYTHQQTNARWRALRHGYWVYKDCSEQSGERWNIYYDGDTHRTKRVEAGLERFGFHVLDGTEL